MAEIQKGGAYKLADGTFVNANGKRISAPSGEVYARPEEPEVLTEEQITPGSSLVDEFGNPIDPLPEEDTPAGKARTRRVTKKS